MLSRHLAYIRTSPCKLNFTDDYFQPNMIISSVADASVINLYSNVTLQYVCHGLKIEKKKKFKEAFVKISKKQLACN